MSKNLPSIIALTAKRFFVNSSEIKFPWAQLKGAEHHHLAHVLRKKTGEKIIVFDEKGRLYQAEIIEIGKNKTSIRLLTRESPPVREVIINLGLGILKAKNMDLVIQKATEWGVARIFPLLTQRTVVKMSEGGEKKIKRWRQIAVEAAKQSGQVLLPQIEKPVNLDQFIQECSGAEKLFLSETKGKILWQALEELAATFSSSSSSSSSSS
ncbi:MAG: hypothetical protein DRJ11_05775, partial [Candidatus Aminicenantes bacterium]